VSVRVPPEHCGDARAEASGADDDRVVAAPRGDDLLIVIF
jgi:hypothetical protein